jgi:hypothetical protein
MATSQEMPVADTAAETNLPTSGNRLKKRADGIGERRASVEDVALSGPRGTMGRTVRGGLRAWLLASGHPRYPSHAMARTLSGGITARLVEAGTGRHYELIEARPGAVVGCCSRYREACTGNSHVPRGDSLRSWASFRA